MQAGAQAALEIGLDQAIRDEDPKEIERYLDKLIALFDGGHGHHSANLLQLALDVQRISSRETIVSNAYLGAGVAIGLGLIATAMSALPVSPSVVHLPILGIGSLMTALAAALGVKRFPWPSVAKKADLLYAKLVGGGAPPAGEAVAAPLTASATPRPATRSEGTPPALTAPHGTQGGLRVGSVDDPEKEEEQEQEGQPSPVTRTKR